MLKIDCGAGRTVLVEASPIGGTGKAVPATTDQAIPVQDAVGKIKDALRILAESGEAIVQSVRQLKTEEATLKMGIGFNAEGSVFIAKVGTAVNFEVTLTFKKPSEQTAK